MKFDGLIAIKAIGKSLRELFRLMMRIYDQLLASELDEMIESETDERFLENRHKRLRQFIRERPESRTEAGA
jgi:hypothetical protein